MRRCMKYTSRQVNVMDKQPIKLKRTTPVKHMGKEGLLIGEDGEKIHDDSWMHPEVFNEEWEKSTNRNIKTHTSKDTLDKALGLYIDLKKAGKLNTSKLVRKPVQVKGKNGKTFTRMQWVDPRTGQPASAPHSRHEEPVGSSQGEGKTQKDHIDEHVKKLSTDQKYKMLEDHGIKWAHNDHPQILHKNKIMALKEHLYKNPHLVGAEHLSKDKEQSHSGTTTDVNEWVTSFVKTDRVKLYELMKRFGITDGDPAVLDPNNKANPIKHMHNMVKFKAYIQDNPHLMEDPDHQPSGINKKPQPTSKVKTTAEKGNNSIDGILKGMPADQLYDLMKKHQISDSDPRLTKGDPAAPIKHMHNMVKLKKLIELNPHILNLGEDLTQDKHDEERKEGMDDKQKHVQEVKDLLGKMDRDAKMKIADQYNDHPTMKARTTSSTDHIDKMHKIAALRKIFEEHPAEFHKHRAGISDEADNKELMGMVIGNKNMGKILRHFLGFKGVGDITNADPGVEWTYKTGFVRREMGDSGRPILSIVDTGMDGDKWDEHIIDLAEVRKFLSGGGAGEEPDTPKVHPLLDKTSRAILDALDKDFDQYDDVLKDKLQDHFRAVFPSHDDSDGAAGFGLAMGIHEDTMASLFDKFGVAVDSYGKVGMDSEAFRQLAFGHMVSPVKSKNINDYVYRYKNGSVNTWAMHESAKKWTQAERDEARMDFIKSNTKVEDSISMEKDDIESHENRMDTLHDMMHKTLSYVPFDIMGDMMARGLKMRFSSTYDGKAHIGNHFTHADFAIDFDKAYYHSADHAGDSALHYVPTQSLDPTSGRRYGHYSFGDVVAHEFAHAMDNYFSGMKTSGGGTYLRWNDEEYGAAHVPKKYSNAVTDSYKESILKHNPNKELGWAAAGTKDGGYWYHKDNLISTYEGRIYDRNYYTVGIQAMKIRKEPTAPGKPPKAFDKAFDTSGSGMVEHWSENVSRYTMAREAFKDWKDSGRLDEWVDTVGREPTFDEWVDHHADQAHRNGYRTEQHPDMEDLNQYGLQGYRRALGGSAFDSTRREGYALAYKALRDNHPHLHSAIKTILDRPDYKGGKVSKSIDLVINLEGLE